MRAATRRKPTQDAGDEIPNFTQRTVPAAGQPAPATTAARSVFDIARGASDVPRTKPAAAPAVDLSTVAIRKGVPKPERQRGIATQYNTLVVKMEPGDSVELPLKQARGFYSAAKKFAATADTEPRPAFSFRKLSPTHGGVWRDA